jgi:hypothetical protein
MVPNYPGAHEPEDCHLALYNVGVYAQDNSGSDPGQLTLEPFRPHRQSALQQQLLIALQRHVPQGAPPLTPYNTLVHAYQPHPFTSVQRSIRRRASAGYDVWNGHTVVRGGFGMFTDLYPAGFLDGFIEPSERLQRDDYLRECQLSGFLNGNANALSSFNGVEAGFANGASSSSLGLPSLVRTADSTIGPPVQESTYHEFNLQIQHQFSSPMPYPGIRRERGLRRNHHEWRRQRALPNRIRWPSVCTA